MFLTDKRAWKKTLKTPSIWIILLFLILGILNQVFFTGCALIEKVDQKRAVEFYDKHVKNFPDENI